MEYGVSGKYLELLKEIAPRVSRAAVLRDPTIAALIGMFAAVQGVVTDVNVPHGSRVIARASARPIDVEKWASAFSLLRRSTQSVE
jgi:hypothetical protein